MKKVKKMAYSQKQIEMFKRIDPNWEEATRDDLLIICKPHDYFDGSCHTEFGVCKIICEGCDQPVFTTIGDKLVPWNFKGHKEHTDDKVCKTKYCCFFNRNFSEHKPTKKSSNEVFHNGQKPIYTRRKKKTTWKKLL